MIGGTNLKEVAEYLMVQPSIPEDDSWVEVVDPAENVATVEDADAAEEATKLAAEESSLREVQRLATEQEALKGAEKPVTEQKTAVQRLSEEAGREPKPEAEAQKTAIQQSKWQARASKLKAAVDRVGEKFQVGASRGGRSER